MQQRGQLLSQNPQQQQQLQHGQMPNQVQAGFPQGSQQQLHASQQQLQQTSQSFNAQQAQGSQILQSNQTLPGPQVVQQQLQSPQPLQVPPNQLPVSQHLLQSQSQNPQQQSQAGVQAPQQIQLQQNTQGNVQLQIIQNRSQQQVMLNQQKPQFQVQGTATTAQPGGGTVFRGQGPPSQQQQQIHITTMSQGQLFHTVQQTRLPVSVQPQFQQQLQQQQAPPQQQQQQQQQPTTQHGTGQAPSYNVVIQHNQPRPQQQQSVQGQAGPKVQLGPRPSPQWTQQQQMEIIRQIQMDPQIKQQWLQMDQQQRTLLVQKLAQRNREEHLRREMMIRQQQMNQQQNAGQAGAMTTTQDGQQHVVGINTPQGHQTIVVAGPGPQQAPQQHSQLITSQLLVQQQKPQQQQQVLIQQQNNSQQLMSPQKIVQPGQGPGLGVQKFVPQPRAMGQSQQLPTSAAIVRTQQIFTPQVAQQQQPGSQQQKIVRHLVVHQGNQNIGLVPRSQIILQQQQGQSSPQKVTVLQQPSQQSGQWSARMVAPGPGQPQFLTPRPQHPSDGQPPQQNVQSQQWTVRTQQPNAGAPPSSSVPYVCVYIYPLSLSSLLS